MNGQKMTTGEDIYMYIYVYAYIHMYIRIYVYIWVIRGSSILCNGLCCRVFCGDLGNEVTDEVLASAFRKYKSFDKARVVRDKRTGKKKGYGELAASVAMLRLLWLVLADRKESRGEYEYSCEFIVGLASHAGFVSFMDPNDMLKAIKEMNYKYVGNRPIRVLRSKWKDRWLSLEITRAFFSWSNLDYPRKFAFAIHGLLTKAQGDARYIYRKLPIQSAITYCSELRSLRMWCENFVFLFFLGRSILRGTNRLQ